MYIGEAASAHVTGAWLIDARLVRDSARAVDSIYII